jgi:hypothetical protein
MPIYVPIRLDRMQLAMVQVLEDGVGVPVHWANTEPSHESLPTDYLVLSMPFPPMPFSRQGARGKSKEVVSTIDLQIDSAVEGFLYSITLNHFQYATTGLAADTPTAIRDRLVTLIEADLLEPVTASDVGADIVRLTADFDGAIRALEISSELSVVDRVVADNIVTLTEGTQMLTVNVEAYSKGQSPMDGAVALLARAYAVFQSPDYVRTLNAYGVGVWEKGIPTSVPVVVGGQWETQDTFELTLSMSAAWVRPADHIDSVENTITLQPGGIETVAVAP